MPCNRHVLGPMLSLAGCLAAQSSPPNPPAPNPPVPDPAISTPREVPVVAVAVGVARVPLLAPQDQQRVSVWGKCAALRRKLGLPAKAPNAHLARVIEPRREAMRHVSLGLAAIRAAESGEAKAKLDPERWQQFVAARDDKVLRHFSTAVVHDPASIDALLALANTSRRSLVATLALRAIEREMLVVHATDGTLSLLSVLLDHSFPAAAELAYSHLEFLLDAGVQDGGVYRQLAERAKHMWPADDRDVRCQGWNPQLVYLRKQSVTSALPPPADLPSRLLVLSALRADEAVLARYLKGDFDPRVLLHAHCLAAPRVTENYAARMFDWYRRHPQKWAGQHELAVNAWKYGVISVLVAALPKLPATRLPWYGTHLVEGNTGAAAKAIALHRLGCLERSRSQAWFRVRSGAMDEIAVADVLPMWHYLGSHEQWALAGCLSVAPRGSSDRVIAHYCRSVLRSAPVGQPAAELELLAAWWPSVSSEVARAIVRRALRHGIAGQNAVNGWLRGAVGKQQARSATAIELAIAHGLRLPARAWPKQASQLCALQELHDAFYADDHSDLNALLKSPVPNVDDCCLRATLHAASRLASWSPELAMFVARATTNAHPDARRAAYAALASEGARAHEISWLAREAAFDVDVDVRHVP